MLFRRAVAEDEEQLKTIAREVAEANYRPFLGDAAVDAFVEGGGLEKDIADGLAETTVASVDGTIVGFAVPRGAVLHALMIAVDRQNMGYGSKLLARVEEDMGQRHRRLALQSFAENGAANNFYRTRGWNAVRGFTDGGIAMIRFEKDLGEDHV